MSPIQKVGKTNIFAKLRQISDVLDTTIFLATDLTTCFKMMSKCFIFLIVTTVSIGFTQMERK